MKFDELAILLPCHSLEDFPSHHEGGQAEGLLAAWTALWHPLLLASAAKLPSWHRADSPPQTVSGRLLVIPEASESLLQAGWADRVEGEGAVVVRKKRTRAEIVSQALAPLNGRAQPIDEGLAGSFHALGLCYLLVELLTRQMRYMSNVDEIHLRNETLAAATATIEGNSDIAEERLKNCFRTLTEARERFYPTEAYLLDLLLVSPTTLGPELEQEWRRETPGSVLLPACLVERIASENPASLAALRSAAESKRLTIIGGENDEREWTVLPRETILGELLKGKEVYRERLGAEPTVFARRRFGPNPMLPGILSRLGYIGAIHWSLDDGQFPHSGQSKIRWEGIDETAIDALNRLPLDAGRPETFLGLPRKIGESMDMDHVATVAFARWPGPASTFYEDLLRMSRYAPVLGKFVTLEDYFEKTTRPGILSKHKPDQYRAPYLKQAITREESDPLSRFARAHQDEAAALSAATSRTLADLLNAPSSTPPGDPSGAETERLARAICPASAGTAATGLLAINTQSFAREILVEVTSLPALPAVAAPVLAVQESAGKKWAIVATPAMGFAYVRPGESVSPSPKPRKPPPTVADGLVLRNEFMEVTLHSETGGIRSVHDFERRTNRISQQIALRSPGPRPKAGDLWRSPDESAEYSTMVAESFEVLATGSALGEIRGKGKLLDRDGARIAGFSQTARLWRGARVLEIEIELEIDRPPRADAWNSYFASRFAWKDEDAEMRRDVGLCSQVTSAKRLEAPGFIEIRGEKTRTSVLTGGLPFHRYIEPRMLDVMLVARGESERRFRLGIGVELTHPAQQAMEFLAPAASIAKTPPPASGATSGWFFHLDAKNVVATHWEAVRESGQAVGFRVRILETEGRAGRVRLRSFRPLASARQLDFRGQPLMDVSASDDTVQFDVAAFEWLAIEGRFR